MRNGYALRYRDFSRCKHSTDARLLCLYSSGIKENPCSGKLSSI